MSDQQQVTIPQIKKYENQGLVGSVKKLYLQAKSSDVKFLFGLTKSTSAGPIASVVAHKNLLAAASPVFDAMFYGDLKEPGDINVPDSSEAAFMEFLQFFYLAEVELTVENIAGVMYLGHKYNVAECISVCNRFLQDIRNVENILMILDLATTYDQQDLVKFCEKYILVNTAAVLKSASFVECGKKVLGHILKMDLLSCPEVEVFEACMLWIKTKSGQEAVSKAMVETHLGELYYQIRFASMTMQQLCNLGAKYDAVLQSDFIAIASIVTIPDYHSKHFNPSPRQIEWNADAAIECSFKNGIDHEYQLFQNEYITFSTSEPILLGGFTCGKIVRQMEENGEFLDSSSDLLVDVEVLETTNAKAKSGKVLLKMKANLQSVDTKIMLSRPVLIRPGFFYRISLSPFPDNHMHYSELLKTEIQMKCNVTIKLHECAPVNIPENPLIHEKQVELIWALDFNNI